MSGVETVHKGGEPKGITEAAAAIDKLFQGKPELMGDPPKEPQTPKAETEEPDSVDEQAGSEDEVEDASEVEDDAEPSDEAAQSFTIDVDGTKQEVTLDELRRGYLREADYTRKTQNVAEQRKALEEAVSAAEGRRKAYSENLEVLEVALSKFGASDEDLSKALNEGRTEDYLRLRHQHDQRRAALDAIRQDKQRLADEETKRLTAETKKFVDEQQQLLVTALPSWRDPEVAKREYGEIDEYAKSRGITQQELGSVIDHRLMLILRDASKYHKLQKARPSVTKKAEKAPPAASPGARKTKGQRDSEKAAASRKRLRETGHVDDAVQAILDRGIV